MIELSIIIPVYNAEKTLSRCLDSILCQNSPCNFEIILVDDGSKDSSLSICNEYLAKDSRIIVRTIPNGGVGNARNIGLVAASGIYIVFADNDDFWEKDFLDVIWNSYIKENNDLIVFGYKQIFKNKDSIKVAYSEDLILDVEHDGNGFIDLLDKNMAFACWNKIYKKDIIDKNNICFRTDITLGEDAFFNIKYFKNIKFIRVVSKCLYNYVQTKGSLMTKYRANQMDIQIEIFNNISENFSMSKENYIKLCNYFVIEAVYGILNLANPKCNLDVGGKIRRIKEICNDLNVQKIISKSDLDIGTLKYIKKLMKFKQISVLLILCLTVYPIIFKFGRK